MISPVDWDIKKCLQAVFWIMLSMLGLMVLGAIGLDIIVLRVIVGFIFLTFVPGILLLRIFKVHNISVLETLLYSAGLSIAFIYFVGLFNNFILPVMGISRPISTLPIMITTAIFILILGVIAYIKDHGFSSPNHVNSFSLKKYFSAPYLLLLLLPILAILGTELVNVYHDNRILLVLLVLIACVVALVAFDRLPSDTYILALLFIAISLILFISLISPQLYTYDIHIQYYYQNLVFQNGYWDPTFQNNYNSCLSLTLFCPIYSLVLNVDGVWILKIIYPLIQSLIPLVLFCICKEQIGGKKAFLTAFFFMAVIGNIIGTEISPGRELMAKLFLLLLILLIVDRKLGHLQKTILSIIFMISIPLSHYSLGYIAMAFFSIGWLVTIVIKNPKILNIWQKLSRLFRPSTADMEPSFLAPEVSRFSPLSITSICLFVVFALTWYIYTTGGTPFNNVVNIMHNVYIQVFEPLGPDQGETVILSGLGFGFWQVQGISKLFRILQYSTEILLVIGFFWMFLRPKGIRLEYFGLVIASFLFLVISMVLPDFSVNFGFRRIYNMCLLILAPLCILGAEGLLHGISYPFKFFSGIKTKQEKDYSLISTSMSMKQYRNNEIIKISSSNYLKYLALIILIPTFLFTTDFIPVVSGRYSESQTLNCAAIVLGPYETDRRVYNKQEINAAAWLWQNVSAKSTVYADAYGSGLLYQQNYRRVGEIPPSAEIPDDAYFFLRAWNIEHNEVVVELGYNQGVHINLLNRPELAKRIENSNIIYDNGSAKFLAPLDHD